MYNLSIRKCVGVVRVIDGEDKVVAIAKDDPNSQYLFFTTYLGKSIVVYKKQKDSAIISILQDNMQPYKDYLDKRSIPTSAEIREVAAGAVNGEPGFGYIISNGYGNELARTTPVIRSEENSEFIFSTHLCRKNLRSPLIVASDSNSLLCAVFSFYNSYSKFFSGTYNTPEREYLTDTGRVSFYITGWTISSRITGKDGSMKLHFFDPIIVQSNRKDEMRVTYNSGDYTSDDSIEDLFSKIVESNTASFLPTNNVSLSEIIGDKSPNAKMIGMAIKSIRESKNKTQRCCENLGISQASLSRFESGIQEISWTNLCRVSLALKVPVSDIVCLAEKM